MAWAAFLPFFPLLSSSPASPVPAMGRPRVDSGWKVRRRQFNQLEGATVTAALAAVARVFGQPSVRAPPSRAE